MSDDLADRVFAALGQQLGLAPATIANRRGEGLEALGLDSHGLMRVLLALEEVLGVSDLEVDDDALETPDTLVAGIRSALS